MKRVSYLIFATAILFVHCSYGDQSRGNIDTTGILDPKIQQQYDERDSQLKAEQAEPKLRPDDVAHDGVGQIPLRIPKDRKEIMDLEALTEREGLSGCFKWLSNGKVPLQYLNADVLNTFRRIRKEAGILLNDSTNRGSPGSESILLCRIRVEELKYQLSTQDRKAALELLDSGYRRRLRQLQDYRRERNSHLDRGREGIKIPAYDDVQ